VEGLQHDVKQGDVAADEQIVCVAVHQGIVPGGQEAAYANVWPGCACAGSDGHRCVFDSQ
jgi:hypothetical protein